MRHSCAHIMAEAICSLWPNAKLVYGPTVEDGFYYDIDLDEPIRPDDFERIEQKMGEIVKADKPFVRKEMTRAEALAKLAGDKYKTDNVNRPTANHEFLFARRRFRGPLPRAAYPKHRQGRRIQDYVCCGGVLARRPEPKNAPAGLWHRLGYEKRA